MSEPAKKDDIDTHIQFNPPRHYGRGASPHQLEERGYEQTEPGTGVAAIAIRDNRVGVVLALREEHHRYTNNQIAGRIMVLRFRWCAEMPLNRVNLAATALTLHELMDKAVLAEKHVILLSLSGPLTGLYRQLGREIGFDIVRKIMPERGSATSAYTDHAPNLPFETAWADYSAGIDVQAIQIDPSCGNRSMLLEAHRDMAHAVMIEPAAANHPSALIEAALAAHRYAMVTRIIGPLYKSSRVSSV